MTNYPIANLLITTCINKERGQILVKGEKIDKKIFDELDYIKKQLAEIKEHMVDIDSLLTSEEKELVFKSIENEERGKLVPFNGLEKMRL